MDLANNERGISTVDRLKGSNPLSDEAILKAFREELDSGKLTIMKKASSGGQRK